MNAKGTVHLPALEGEVDPLRRLRRRLLIAVLAVVVVALVVYIDRDGYTDGDDDAVSLLDALYYATVTMSTTGYGDIAPVSDSARLANVIVITPMRVLFLVVLIGTTLETLTARSRAQIRLNRWRRKLRDHIVVIGYGVKGRSAIATLLAHEFSPDRIVVVDPSPAAVAEANDVGMVAVLGDATRSDVLRRAGVPDAKRVLVTTDRDDASVLATLTVRELNPSAEVIVAVREADNVALVRQGGADEVVTSSDAAGRMLGLSTVSPALGRVLRDLITSGEGLEVTERDVDAQEVGMTAKQVDDLVMAVVRDGTVLPYHSPSIGQLAGGDRLVVVRPADAKRGS